MSAAVPVSHDGLESTLSAKSLKFAIPECAVPGQQLQIQHDGQTLVVEVPVGTTPGQMIEIDTPIQPQVHQGASARQTTRQLQRDELLERFNGVKPETITLRYLVVIVGLLFGLMFILFTLLEITLEADDLADGKSTWAAKWMAIRTTVLAVLKFFIYPTIGRLSDKIGRKGILVFSFFGLGITTFLFAAFLTTYWYWWVLVVFEALFEPGLSVIGAGIKDTIPHEQYALADVDDDKGDPNLGQDKGKGNSCCICCCPSKFSAMSIEKLNSIVGGYFIFAGIVAVFVVKTIFVELLGSNLAASRATFCVGSCVLVATGIYVQVMLPETIDPKVKKLSGSVWGMLKSGDLLKEYVSPVTAMRKLFGPEALPELRWWALWTFATDLITKFDGVINLYIWHRYGLSPSSDWTIAFAVWLFVSASMYFFTFHWLKCCGQKLVERTDDEGRKWEEENGLGERNGLLISGFLSVVWGLQAPWNPVAMWGIFIPVTFLFAIGAIPSLTARSLRQRIMGYGKVAEYKGYMETLDLVSNVIVRIPAALLWAWCIEQNTLAGSDGCPDLMQHPLCEGANTDLVAHLEQHYAYVGPLNVTAEEYAAKASLWSACPGGSSWYEGQCVDDDGGSILCTRNEDEWDYGSDSRLKWGSSCDRGLPVACKAAADNLVGEALLTDCWKEQNCGFHSWTESHCPGLKARHVNVVDVIPGVLAMFSFGILIFFVFATKPWDAVNKRSREESLQWLAREGKADIVQIAP